ncbi:MAG: DUF4912 domain-containing protein [Candidatus Omnitrophica bacterium]|jgi:hypothetical protein|nr:DUF4912 domain-containing protein [Candidatus Omnitrophota bacterium]MDD5079486.1 DUF4912 domain-containing protein [Candidatus Omnitrophota bacterium]
MAVLRRIKDKIKKAVLKKKVSVSAKTKKTVSRKKKAKPPVVASVQAFPLEMRKELLGVQEMAVEKSKFSHPQVKKFRRSLPAELPGQYNKDMMALQVRDPWWLHCYWEVAANTWSSLRERLKDLFNSAKKVLRVYDVSQINFNGKNSHKFFDIEVHHESTSWYIDTGGPGRSWCVDYGLKLANGDFITILRSNTVSTPLDGPSWITDEEWMIPEEMFGRLYGMGFGLGHSSPIGKAWQERFKRALFSGILSSPGMTSSGSPVMKKSKDRKFRLTVDCELIVYGATEPDAAVTIQGKPIKLRPDGTFTMRYALPDGKQAIPVKAVSNDKIEERTITPIVSRETRASNLVKEFARE